VPSATPAKNKQTFAHSATTSTGPQPPTTRTPKELAESLPPSTTAAQPPHSERNIQGPNPSSHELPFATKEALDDPKDDGPEAHSSSPTYETSYAIRVAFDVKTLAVDRGLTFTKTLASLARVNAQRHAPDGWTRETIQYLRLARLLRKREAIPMPLALTDGSAQIAGSSEAGIPSCPLDAVLSPASCARLMIFQADDFSFHEADNPLEASSSTLKDYPNHAIRSYPSSDTLYPQYTTDEGSYSQYVPDSFEYEAPETPRTCRFDPNSQHNGSPRNFAPDSS
jgi:hypothetical protein